MLEKYATKPTYDENGRILAFKLAPCPFCGGNELKILDDSGVIYCRTCSTTGPQSEHPGHAWNEWYYRINGTSEKRYVEPIRIAGKLEIQVGMLDGCHNGEFCLHTVAENMEEGRMIPFWTTRLETEELKELRNAISEALLIASRF